MESPVNYQLVSKWKHFVQMDTLVHKSFVANWKHLTISLNVIIPITILCFS